MKKALAIILIFVFAGCANMNKTTLSQRKDAPVQKQQKQTQMSLPVCKETVKSLQNTIAEKDRELQEKDQRILQLRKKLEMFGVFEK